MPPATRRWPGPALSIGAVASSASSRCWSAVRAAGSVTVANRSRSDWMSEFAGRGAAPAPKPPSTRSNSLAVPSVTPRRTLRAGQTAAVDDPYPPGGFLHLDRSEQRVNRACSALDGRNVGACLDVRAASCCVRSPVPEGRHRRDRRLRPRRARSRMRAKNSWRSLRRHLLHPLHHPLPPFGVRSSASTETSGRAESACAPSVGRAESAASSSWRRAGPGLFRTGRSARSRRSVRAGAGPGCTAAPADPELGRHRLAEGREHRRRRSEPQGPSSESESRFLDAPPPR